MIDHTCTHSHAHTLPPTHAPTPSPDVPEGSGGDGFDAHTGAARVPALLQGGGDGVGDGASEGCKEGRGG